MDKMEIRITKKNIDQYLDKKTEFKNVQKIRWAAGELVKEVIDNFPNIIKLNCIGNNVTSLEALKNCVNLQQLYCCDNRITTLNGLSNCVNLQILYCSKNKITTLDGLSNCVNLHRLYCNDNKITTLEGLNNCVNLIDLDCSSNEITTLEGLRNCVNLLCLQCVNNQITTLEGLISCNNASQIACVDNLMGDLGALKNKISLIKLCCDDNEITTLEGLRNCTNLEMLHCGGNQITTLDGLINCTNLQKLYCSDNEITTLEGLSNCTALIVLQCYNNKITTIEGLRNCTNLRDLCCTSNQITTLDTLIYLRNLILINFLENPMEIQNIQITRILNRIRTNRAASIYNDKQNVHDTMIQRTVCESVQNLLRDPKPDFSIEDIINSSLNDKTKIALIEYCQDETVHSVHLITYEELLSYVWNRIIKSEFKEQLMRILEEQIADSICKCFTGRFNRTLSVLDGFYDDIKINISDNSRIGAIILNCRDKIVPYDLEKHKQKATNELLDAGYMESEIRTWIEAIDE